MLRETGTHGLHGAQHSSLGLLSAYATAFYSPSISPRISLAPEEFEAQRVSARKSEPYGSVPCPLSHRKRPIIIAEPTAPRPTIKHLDIGAYREQQPSFCREVPSPRSRSALKFPWPRFPGRRWLASGLRQPGRRSRHRALSSLPVTCVRALQFPPFGAQVRGPNPCLLCRSVWSNHRTWIRGSRCRGPLHHRFTRTGQLCLSLKLVLVLLNIRQPGTAALSPARRYPSSWEHPQTRDRLWSSVQRNA